MILEGVFYHSVKKSKRRENSNTKVSQLTLHTIKMRLFGVIYKDCHHVSKHHTFR